MSVLRVSLSGDVRRMQKMQVQVRKHQGGECGPHHVKLWISDSRWKLHQVQYSRAAHINRYGTRKWCSTTLLELDNQQSL